MPPNSAFPVTLDKRIIANALTEADYSSKACNWPWPDRMQRNATVFVALWLWRAGAAGGWARCLIRYRFCDGRTGEIRPLILRDLGGGILEGFCDSQDVL